MRRRAVVLLEPDHRGARKIALEAENVGDLRPAPAVDRLVVVADAAQVAARLGEQLQPFVLDGIGVLIFVDQQIFEAGAVALEHVLVGAQDDQYVEQQIAEVAGVHRLQARLILRVEIGAAAVGIGFRLARIDLFGSEALVLPAVDAGGQLASGPALFIDLGGDDQLLHQAELVVGVEDGEVRLQPGQLGVDAQHLGGDRVKGAEPRHPFDRAAADATDPLAHFACGLVGESDREDLARPGLAGGNEVGEAGGKRGGLPRPCAGQHQHRPFGRQHRLALGRVQAGEIGGLGRQGGGFGHVAPSRTRRTERQQRGVGQGLADCSRYPRYPQPCSC